MTKPQTVRLVFAAAGVFAVVAGALLFFHAGSHNGTATTTAPAEVTTRSDGELKSTALSATAPATQATAATAVSASAQWQKEASAPAVDTGGASVFFSGVYAPDSRAEDIATGDVVHVRALFGSGYTDGVLTFDSDGAFSDTLVTPEGRTGTYRAEGDNIRLVGLSGQAPEITVTAWKDDGVTPATFCAVYKTAGDTGYRVYFSEK